MIRKSVDRRVDVGPVRATQALQRDTRTGDLENSVQVLWRDRNRNAGGARGIWPTGIGVDEPRVGREADRGGGWEGEHGRHDREFARSIGIRRRVRPLK